MRTGVKVGSAIFVVSLLLGLVPGPTLAADFDGTYTGAWKLVRDNSGRSRCPPDRTFTITVQDGKFETSWRRQPGEVVLKPDGSFQTTIAGASVSGQIRGDSLEADIADATCVYHWSLKRQP